MRSAIGIWLALLGLAACGDDDGGAAVREGLCCPISSTPCAGELSFLGGWAATEPECNDRRPTTTDGNWERVMDEHGCAVWIESTAASAVCCGCPRPDAGTPDGGEPGGDAALPDAAPPDATGSDAGS